MGIEAAIIGGGLGLIGSSMAGRSAERAARTSADAQMRAAELAAEEARFRPVGITTRFGQSQFGFDDAGRLTSAGYSLDPEIRALQERLLGATPESLERGLLAGQRIAPVEQAAQGLFGLGAGYLAESPEAARERYMAQQTALLDPIRQREEQRLGASVFGRGRAGLSVGDMGQPELFALASARRQQDLELARQAEEASRQQIGFGAGLFGTGAQMLGNVPAYETAALGPFQTQLGLGQTIEQLGQQPLDIGAQLGGRTATAGAQAGQALLQGGLGAAQTRLSGQQAALGMQYGAFRDVLGQLTRPGLFGSPSPVGLPAPISGPSYPGIPGMEAPASMMPSASIYPVAGWGGTSYPIR